MLRTPLCRPQIANINLEPRVNDSSDLFDVIGLFCYRAGNARLFLLQVENVVWMTPHVAGSLPHSSYTTSWIG